MCEDGCMEGVDVVVGAHMNPTVDCGKIKFNYSNMSATSRGFYLDIYGKASHAAAPHKGIDAIALSYEIYSAMQVMRAREIDPKAPVILGIGEVHGGHANNVVCDHVRMHGTIRTADDETGGFVYRRIDEIARAATAAVGAGYELTTTKHYPAVVNTPELAKIIYRCGEKVLGKDNVIDTHTHTMGGEDFAFYLQHKPGVFFYVGARDTSYPLAPAHNSKYIINEDALTVGPAIFFEFVRKYCESIGK